MEILYFISGFVIGNGCSYLWFLVGRNTGYQDKNVEPPPPPIEMNPKIDLFTSHKKENPPGWIDDLHDPSIANYEPGREL